jgi:FAD/FMN-containing dehydrogenase
MSKVAEYLQEHITGEVSVQPAILDAMSRDGSVLQIKPEMVVYPRVTNDIRKVARFSWQLAEKGHILPITARGAGTDETGAAIGKGSIVSMTAHMNKILEFDPKQKLVRVQPGLNTKTLSDALLFHGMSIPALAGPSAAYTTLGGAVASNSNGMYSGKFGAMRTWTHQLEVVLANGDVLQTGRISKRELNHRKGLQTFEGEIYRSLDDLIEENKELIEEKVGENSVDASGYSAIANVKQKDGSFDLTPLIVGSQGTLGIVSEMILRADFVGLEAGLAVAAFTTKEAARDVLDELKKLEPGFLEYFDGELFDIAASRGRRYSFYKDIDGMLGAAIVVGFNDFGNHARHKHLKKVEKVLKKTDAIYEIANEDDAASLMAVREVTSFILSPDTTGASAPPLLDGAYVPPERLEEFSKAVSDLAAKHHVQLPLHVDALTGIIYTRPELHLHKVADKQKIFKLLDEYGAIVAYHGGYLVAEGGEGRVKARFTDAQHDDDVKELYAAVRAVFDPYGILNPGVKQSVDVRHLVAQLRKDYDTSAIAGYVPYR